MRYLSNQPRNRPIRLRAAPDPLEGLHDAKTAGKINTQLTKKKKNINHRTNGLLLLTIVKIFLSWQLGAERQTCHVTLIVAYVMN